MGSLFHLFAEAFLELMGYHIRKAILFALFVSIIQLIFFRKKMSFYRLSFFLYLYLLASATLFGRHKKYDPFSYLWGGWCIFRSGDSWNFDALYNMVLLTPLIYLLYRSFPKILHVKNEKKGVGPGYVVALSFCISLGLSFFIETMQIIFCVGTFQLADLVYNTCSGIVGGMLYWLMHRSRKGRDA